MVATGTGLLIKNLETGTTYDDFCYSFWIVE